MKDDPKSKRKASAADHPFPKSLKHDAHISDELSLNHSSPPLPAWAVQEALRRRDELSQNSQLALTHDEIWKRIQVSREG